MRTLLRRYRLIALLLGASLPAAIALAAGGAQQPDVQVHNQRAQEALRENDPATAISEYNETLKLDPNNIDARANLGVIAFMQRRYADAAENFHQVLALQSTLWKVQALLGFSEKQLGHSDEARKWLESSFPHLEEPKIRTQAGMDLVELDYQAGDLSKVVGILDTLHQLDPKDVDVLYATYRTYSDMASSALDSIALVAPDSARMHLIIAEHMINAGDLHGAIGEYKKAIELDPRLPGAHLELGEALLQESKSADSRQQAEQNFKAELALNPWDVKTQSRLGDLYQSDSNLDFDAAYKSYARALEIQPGYADAQLGMGRLLARQGQNQKAVDYLLEASRLDPLNSTVHYRLSQVYRRLGRPEDADKEMARFKYLEDSKEKIRRIYREMHQVVADEPVNDQEAPASPSK